MFHIFHYFCTERKNKRQYNARLQGKSRVYTNLYERSKAQKELYLNFCPQKNLCEPAWVLSLSSPSQSFLWGIINLTLNVFKDNFVDIFAEFSRFKPYKKYKNELIRFLHTLFLQNLKDTPMDMLKSFVAWDVTRNTNRIFFLYLTNNS